MSFLCFALIYFLGHSTQFQPYVTFMDVLFTNIKIPLLKRRNKYNRTFIFSMDISEAAACSSFVLLVCGLYF